MTTPDGDADRRASRGPLVGRETLRLASGSALFFAARLGGAGFTFGAQVLLARLIGAAEFGRYAEAYSWMMVLTTICTLGIPQAGMRIVGLTQASGDDAQLHGFLRRSHQLVLASGSLLALCGAGVLWGAALFEDSDPAWPMILAFACLPAFGLIRLHSGLALAFSRFTLSQVPSTLVRPTMYFALVWLVWRLGSPLDSTRAMTLHLGVMLAVAIGQAWLFRRVIRPLVPQAAPAYQTRAWLRLSTPLFLVALYGNFYPELNVVLLSLFLPPEDVAVFSAAFRTAFLIGFGIISVNSIIMPRLSRLHAEGDRAGLRQVLVRGTLLNTGAGLLAVVVFGIWGRSILSIFGPEFARGYWVLMVLAVAQLVKAVLGPVMELLNVTGHQNTSLLVSVVSLVTTAALVALFARQFGIEGAAVVGLVVTAISTLWMHGAVVRFLGVSPSILGRWPRG